MPNSSQNGFNMGQGMSQGLGQGLGQMQGNQSMGGTFGLGGGGGVGGGNFANPLHNNLMYGNAALSNYLSTVKCNNSGLYDGMMNPSIS